MNDSSRTQGGLICIGVVVLGAWFLLALLQGSYWALAIPVAILVFFVLGLTFWIPSSCRDTTHPKCVHTAEIA